MNLTELLALAGTIGKLKSIERWHNAVWDDRKFLQRHESTADHSFRLALLALTFARRLDLDTDRAVRIALVHDLPEAVLDGRDLASCGDSGTGADGHAENPTLREKKHAAELAAAREIFPRLGADGEEFFALWEEYEHGTTIEARLVRALDKLESAIQLLEYRRGKELDRCEMDFMRRHVTEKTREFPEIAELAKGVLDETERSVILT